MFTSEQILTFAYESEYKTAYDLSQKRNFTTPKIYTAKGDLSKRWYVYFSFRNPETGKLKRITPFYGITNKYKTKEDRMEVLTIYRKTLLKLLNLGYNPFKDNTELYNRLNSKKTISRTGVHTTKTPHKETNGMGLVEAFDFSLNIKRQLLSKTTTRSYQNRVDSFTKWIKENHPEVKTIIDLNKKLVSSFLNDVLNRTSARNRNNYRTDLSSLLQVLEDNDIIETNFIKKIPVLKSTPKRNKTYSEEIQQAIFKHLETNDTILLLYIKFISYNFLRPIEVCRLKVKDIDIESRTIRFKAKNSPLKTKIIPEILWKELPDLSVLDKESVLFTPNNIGAMWDTALINRRNYFSKRFKKMVKEPFNLGPDYTLYSFRHTFITKLYRALVKESSPFEAKSKLMLITGHSTMSALEKYLRDIDAELPEDYSEMLKTSHG